MLNKDRYLVAFQSNLDELEKTVTVLQTHKYRYNREGDITRTRARWLEKLEQARAAMNLVGDVIDAMNKNKLTLVEVAKRLKLQNRQALEHILRGNNLKFWSDGTNVLKLQKAVATCKSS